MTSLDVLNNPNLVCKETNHDCDWGDWIRKDDTVSHLLSEMIRPRYNNFATFSPLGFLNSFATLIFRIEEDKWSHAHNLGEWLQCPSRNVSPMRWTVRT